MLQSSIGLTIEVTAGADILGGESGKGWDERMLDRGAFECRDLWEQT